MEITGQIPPFFKNPELLPKVVLIARLSPSVLEMILIQLSDFAKSGNTGKQVEAALLISENVLAF